MPNLKFIAIYVVVVTVLTIFFPTIHYSEAGRATGAAIRSLLVAQECEEAQTKLLKGEVKDEQERKDIGMYVARYCED